MQLKRYKSKDYRKIGIGVLVGICIGLLTGIFLYHSFASFETNTTIPFMNGNIEDLGDVYFAYYIDNTLVSEMPKQNTGYIFDEEKSNCTNNARATWNYSEWFPEVRDLTKPRTKCTLYFKKTKTVNTVLGELEVYEYTPDFSISACDDETCGTHEKGIYETTDEDGITYYYRGSVENNYFYFANLWWRVVRINGDGTIRLIYDGTTAHANGESSTDRQYETSQFNQKYDDNMYAGYMYTSGEVHGLSTSSTIKQANDAFYDAKLASYASYIDTNAGFCGDRSTLNLQSGVGTGAITTYNKGYLRVVESDPSLACENASDLYTLASSTKGNKALTHPIGLITVDEVLLSGTGGGVFDGTYNHQPTNIDGYLTIGNTFWTMTPAGGYVPFDYAIWVPEIFHVTVYGHIDDNYSTYTYGLRPVINIRSDVTISGNGTIDNPYQIAEN